MKRVFILLLAILVALLATHSCEYLDTVALLDGRNDTDYAVWFSYSDYGEYSSGNLSTFHEGGITLNNYTDYFRYLEPHATKLIFFLQGKGCEWKKLFPKGLVIRVWKDETIQDIGWESFLRENGHMSSLYEEEYVLTVSDLDSLDYLITYPPSDSLTHFLNKNGLNNN
ncbi:MAG: hypothetical protein K6A64_07060 [Bacteroidales bacterium]|nr:hypothetical protein [Bacteroidales bacterium]